MFSGSLRVVEASEEVFTGVYVLDGREERGGINVRRELRKRGGVDVEEGRESRR